MPLTVSEQSAVHAMPVDQLVCLTNKQLCDKGQRHWRNSELDSALICFNIVANRADHRQSIEEKGFVSASLSAMGSIYTMDFSDYERAMQYFLKSEQYAKKHHFDFQLVDIYEKMATLEQAKSDLLHDFAFNPDALELHRKAFNLAANYGSPQHVMVVSLNNMITTALGEHKMSLIKNELETFRDYKIFDSVPARLFAKSQCAAAIHVLNERYDSALFYLARLDGLLDVVDHDKPSFKIVAHENMYFVCRDKGDVAAALRELGIMEKIATENHLQQGIITVLLHKRDLYDMMGNAAKAEEFDLRYRQARDQFLEETKAAKVDEEKVLFQLNEAKHEIYELSYKQRIQQTELIAVAVVAVLMLTLLVLAWVNYRRTKQKNETLYQHNMQLMANEDRLRQLHQAEKEATSASTVKYRRSNMEGDDIAQVMEKVDRVMESSTEIFSADFSLDRLAELTGETRLRLSQAINKVPGRTFYSILNGYRVREACRRMDDKEQYGGLTIEAIGQSVGFKNRSSFVAIFKRITGLTPSAYFKQPTASGSPTSKNHAD